MKYKILFVDDEKANLRLLERLFRDSYDVLMADSGAEALELLAVHDVALIISDQRMPGMTGIEFLKLAAEMRPQTVRIMLTGYTDAGALVEAVNSALVYKYVSKPWNNEDLQQTAKRALQHYETIKAQRQLQSQNERLQARLKATRDSFIEVVGDMLELKEPQSREHARRASEYAVAIGETLDLERPELEQLGLAAFLHEAALFRIPNDILHKDTPMTAADHQIIRDNFESGIKMLEGVPDLTDVAEVLRFQFEQFDGNGLPAGFAGEQIPLHARIISVAAAYDAMTAPRICPPGISEEAAIRSLQSEAGRRFDPKIVEAFCSLRAVDNVIEYDLELLSV